MTSPIRDPIVPSSPALTPYTTKPIETTLPYGVESRIVELVKEWKKHSDAAFTKRSKINTAEMSEPIVRFLKQFRNAKQYNYAIDKFYQQTLRIFEKDGADKAGIAKIKMKELLNAIPEDNFPIGVDPKILKKKYT